jgi:hypothetical protein
MPAALSNMSDNDLHVLAEQYAIPGQVDMGREQLIVALRERTGEIVDGFEDADHVPAPVEPTAAAPSSSQAHFIDPNANAADVNTRSTEADAMAAMADAEAHEPVADQR